MFISISALTSYPFSNPNRGEDGSPKSAVYGGVTRMRISSQCQKRQWRLALATNVQAGFSTRTCRIGLEVADRLAKAGWADEKSHAAAAAILQAFGKQKAAEKADAADSKQAEATPAKKAKKSQKIDLNSSEMVVLGHEEIEAVTALVERLIAEKRQPTAEEVAALPRPTSSVDVALFGRMRAAKPILNVDGAVSVAHALTVNKANIDDDLWTSVDDLNQYAGESGMGAGGMGTTELGAGIFYQFACVDLDRLTANLGGDRALAVKATRELVKAVATVHPRGYRSTTGTVVHAGYVRVDSSDSPSPNLMSAFEHPLNTMDDAVKALRDYISNLQATYGLSGHSVELCVGERLGSLDALTGAVS
jgi:CRISPR system Cascade subunit CasC